MIKREINNRIYETDDKGFLLKFEEWDREFAEDLAPELGITAGLTDEHWKVIDFIRDSFKKSGTCPLVFQTCRFANLRLKDFRGLFPSGYLRGACKLAGITYKEGYQGYMPYFGRAEKTPPPTGEKTYVVDLYGFLTDPDSWDENYAASKAHELKMPKGLTDAHWYVIRFLRESFSKNGVVPTVFEACEGAKIDLEELEQLFPDGYQRGAVKISGLRVR